ncbi:MAG: ATP-binding cassette domain-containing protein [Limnochordia bacterium]|nr:ATP-binding cassette domain-containing protein [Limnochordia bacterium]
MSETTQIGFRDTLRIIGRALTVSVRTKGTMSLIVNFAGFAVAFLPILIARTLARFTDEVQLLSQQDTTTMAATAFGALATLILLYVIQTAYTNLQDYFYEADSMHTVAYIKKAIINCTSRVEYKYIENEGDFRDKLLFAQGYAGQRVAESMQQVLLVIQYLITFVSIIIVLIAVSPWVVLILLVTCIPAVVLSILQKDEEYRNKTKTMKEGAMSVHLFYIGAGANERCRSMADLRFNGIYPWVKEKWRSVSDDYLKIKNDLSRKHVIYNSIADILRNVVYIGVLLVTAFQIYQNPILGLGVFMLVFTMAGQLQTVTTRLFTGISRFFGDIKYMKDFFDLNDTPQEKLEDNPRTLTTADIAFEQVSFTYPNSSHAALREVSVNIKQGEKVAIVGENGSGKSTFVNLLCGVYQPTTGNITIGGYNLRDNLRAARRAISVVFQSFGRYEATIRENITIADSTRQASDNELKAYATDTGAYDFIKAQPLTFNEEVGTFSKTGNNLSGGQWQKVALTRALYRDKARMMILDEPTAALDPVAEAELYRQFSRLTGDKTTILISHRLGITNVVDRILVFDNGRIVEDGTHAELIKGEGKYAEMYRAQAQLYA